LFTDRFSRRSTKEIRPMERGLRYYLPVVALSLVKSVAACADLELVIDSGSPTLKGLGSSGSVAWLAVTRESLRDTERVRFARTVEPVASGETSAELPWTGEIPWRGTFVGVEVGTGVAAFGTKDPKGVIRGTGGGLRASGPGLAIPGQSLQILAVRPGGLVWHGSVADGSAEDLDGAADGMVSFDLASLTAVGAAPPAASIAVGDRIWAIDLDTLALHELVVAGGAR
jgi:hypothetical protein